MEVSSQDRDYDAIVIGTGQAGPSLAVDLAQAGQKVAVIERQFFGGTCVNTGCIPTKTLIANARAAHVVRTAGDFGVNVDGFGIDMKKVKERKDRVSENSRHNIEKMLRSTPNCTVYTGHARFVSDHEVQVGDTILKAPRIFINVGCRAAIPDIEGLDGISYFTNSTMMHVDTVPEHLVIVGGSYIALEFAQMYRRFGSRVTVLQRGARLIGREDAEVADAVRQLLEDEGVEVLLGVEQIAVSKSGEQVQVRATSNGAPVAIQASHVLVATGRQPNTDELGLENTGIRRNEAGYIEADDTLQTSVAGVWALGDCNGRGAFTHTSYNDYEIVAANLLHGGSRRVSDRITAYAIYTDPPFARVGMNEADIRKDKRKALVGMRPMTRVGRAFERGETRGFMKVFVDAESRLILGASLFGIEADEAVHSILDTMYAKKPYTVIQQAVHIHPTVSELIPTLLGDLKPLESA
jgi:pyruvate/2-oxoglutarate dehydrogenase complex dihydrolipoamide dehydrogenase (E3) component